MALLVGNNGLSDTTKNLNPDTMYSYTYTADKTGTANSIVFYATQTGREIGLRVYDSSDNLIADVISPPTVIGKNIAYLPVDLSITEGVDYRLGVDYSGFQEMGADSTDFDFWNVTNVTYPTPADPYVSNGTSNTPKLRLYLQDTPKLKPDGPYEVNANNSIASDSLKFLFVPDGGDLVDLVSGDIGVAVGVTQQEDADGWALVGDSGQNLLWADVAHDIGTGPFSMIVAFKWDGTTQNWQTAISLPNNSEMGMYIPRNETDNYVASDSTLGSTANFNLLAVDANGLAYYGMSGTGTGASPDGWRNGITQVGSNVLAYAGGTTGVRLFAGQGGENGHGRIYGAAVFQRVLTDDEWESVTNNFYQLITVAGADQSLILPDGTQYTDSRSSAQIAGGLQHTETAKSPTGPTVISQERGSFQMASGFSTITVTLGTAIDETHSILNFGMRGNHNQPQFTLATGEILSGGTQIKFTRVGASAGVVFEFRWSVTQFDSTVDVQHVTLTAPSALSATITAVDLTRSIIISGGVMNGGSTAGNDDAIRIKFSDSTTVLGELTGVGTQVAKCQVVSFASEYVQSVQYVEQALAASSSDTITIATVDTSKSLLFASALIAANFVADQIWGMKFLNSTTIDFAKPSGSSNWTVGVFVIEFTGFDVTNASIVDTSNATEDVAITSGAYDDVFLGATMAAPYWLSSAESDDSTRCGAWTIDLDTVDNIQFRRWSGAFLGTLNYQLIDWGQFTATGVLTVQSLSVATTVSNVDLNTPLLAADLSVATTVSNVDFVQQNILASDDLAVATSISVVDFVSHQSILSDDLAVATLISEPVFVQQNVLGVDSQAVATTISAPDLIQQNILAVDSQAVATEISEVSLAENADLIVQDLSVATTISNAELVENFVLAVDSLNVATLIDNADLIQHNILAVNDLAVATQISEAGLTQQNILVVNSLLVNTSASNVSLSSAGVLGVDSVFVNTSISEPALVQQNILIVDDMAVGTVITQSDINALFAILPTDMEVGTSISIPTLLPDNALLVDDMSVSTLLSSVIFDGAVVGCLAGEVVLASLLGGTVTIQSVLSGKVTTIELLDGTVTIQ